MNFFTYLITALVILAIILYLFKNKRKTSNGSAPYSFDTLTGAPKQDLQTYQEEIQDTKHQPPYEEKTK